jgi:hypothetical protein
MALVSQLGSEPDAAECLLDEEDGTSCRNELSAFLLVRLQDGADLVRGDMPFQLGTDAAIPLSSTGDTGLGVVAGNSGKTNRIPRCSLLFPVARGQHVEQPRGRGRLEVTVLRRLDSRRPTRR